MITGSFSSREVAEKLYIYESVLFEVSSDKSKQRIVAGALRRPDNAATEAEAVFVYDYLMKRYVAKNYGNVNDQIFTQLNESFGNTEIVCQDDVIPGAYGRYGWDITNPIPVRGIPAEPIYLNRLRTKEGRVIKWHRLGSTGAKNIKNPIDIYILSDAEGNDVGTIYVSPYQGVISSTAPEGLSLE